MQLVHQCLLNAPDQRPSAEELLQQLEAVRAQVEGAYGQLVKVDMEKVRLLREKNTEIRRLEQQIHQLEVGIVVMDTYLIAAEQQDSTVWAHSPCRLRWVINSSRRMTKFNNKS